jgi:hypothetical protein
MFLYLKFKHADVFQTFDNQTIQAFIPRLQLLVTRRGEVIAYRDDPCIKMTIIMEGTIFAIED